MTGRKPKGADLSGLDAFNVSSLLSSSKQETKQPDGSVSFAELALFHEDPDNARKEFDPEKLKELADSMKAINPNTGKPRGVLQPLSVRHHPEIEGHFIINGGNRRFRAAIIAGLSEIPYFIGGDVDSYDKIVDNIIREGLSPLETALFIKGRLETGEKPGEIAKRLGKKPSFVSDHSIFFDMADCIRDLYDSHRCRSMQALALLHRTYKKHKNSVQAFCARVKGELTTAQVRSFADNLKKPQKQKGLEAPQLSVDAQTEQEQEAQQEHYDQSSALASPSEKQKGDLPDQALDETIDDEPAGSIKNTKQPLVNNAGKPSNKDPIGEQADQAFEENTNVEKVNTTVILVKHDDREAQLLLNRRPEYGSAWIKYADDDQEVEVKVNTVNLVAVIEV